MQDGNNPNDADDKKIAPALKYAFIRIGTPHNANENNKLYWKAR